MTPLPPLSFAQHSVKFVFRGGGEGLPSPERYVSQNFQQISDVSGTPDVGANYTESHINTNNHVQHPHISNLSYSMLNSTEKQSQ